MAELFIELFSEEIPAKLQIDARNKIKNMLEEATRRDIQGLISAFAFLGKISFEF